MNIILTKINILRYKKNNLLNIKYKLTAITNISRNINISVAQSLTPFIIAYKKLLFFIIIQIDH